jgi:hypothetical protein
MLEKRAKRACPSVGPMLYSYENCKKKLINVMKSNFFKILAFCVKIIQILTLVSGLYFRPTATPIGLVDKRFS